MRKSDGSYTYFLPDVAYHVTKWQRGFHRAINVQGSDHHSTVTRVRAGLQALEIGIPAGYPEYVLHQMVTVMKGGEEMKISKRAGQLRDRARPDRRGRARRGALFLPDAQGRLAARVRRRPRALAVGGEPGLLHPDGARAALGHFPRGRNRRRDDHGRRRELGVPRRARGARADQARSSTGPSSCRAPPTRSSRTASRTTCSRPRGWCILGTTSITCWASRSTS